jgi:glycosyltransferase involved in cell wall biosynthesis
MRMASLRILMVNYEFPPLGGGAGNATENLAQEMAKLGADIRVLTSAFQNLPREENRDGFTIQRVPVIRHHADRCTPYEMMTFIVSASVAGLRLFRRWRPDITIAFFGIPGGPVCLLLKMILNTPYIVSLRGGDVPGHQPEQLALFHFITKPFIKIIWRNSDAVIANSLGLKKVAEITAGNIPVKVISNGVDIKKYHPPSLLREKDEKTKLLFVGRVSYEKGLQYIIPALAQLSHLPWTFFIVGDGHYLSEIKKISTNHHIIDRLHFPGWIGKEELLTWYHQADIFVFPSSYEGMPNSVMEAIACGLPVVGTRISGIEDLVKDGVNGITVQVGDVDALVQAVEKLINNPCIREKMGEAGREFIANSFSWEKAAQSYLELCQSYVGKR